MNEYRLQKFCHLITSKLYEIYITCVRKVHLTQDEIRVIFTDKYYNSKKVG